MDATGIETPQPGLSAAHVIVVGNEKGGSGKSTTAMHLAVALLKAGWRVASIDTDSRQRSLTRYVENRSRSARRLGRPLEIPHHYLVPAGEGQRVTDIEELEYLSFSEVLDTLGRAFDFVVVDTPATNTHLSWLSHGLADTLVTPLNDSYVDLDVVGHVDHESLMVEGIGHYADLVLEARRRRAAIDGAAIDWVVVRNRMWGLGGRNQQRMAAGLQTLADRLGFRVAPGISERLAFRELYPAGLTVLDLLERSFLGVEPTMSHVAARREVRGLVDFLALPNAGRQAVRAEAVQPGLVDLPV
jgi:chromosome partitioning protein